MRDVAALAGVSLKTVSRVVNQAPNVAPDLVTRVLDAVRLLDYRPNLTASSLRRADRKTAASGSCCSHWWPGGWTGSSPSPAATTTAGCSASSGSAARW